MNTKSLLLGSAVAMVAATGAARAADTVVFAPEPEPMEYVRICDVYGAGFYYIPGTETCLKIGGYVWYQMGGDSYRNAGDTPSYHYGTGANDGWNKSSRARLNVDAREETEWGTLRSYLRIQGTWEAVGVANDGNASIDQAFIELGGLRMGYTEGAWTASQYGGAGQFGSHSWSGMYYGYQQRQLIAYSFSGGGGFHGTLSLENDTVYGSGSALGTGDGWLPDVVAVAGFDQGWGGAWAKIGYDEAINAANQDALGVELGLSANLTANDNIRVLGFYATGDTQYHLGFAVGHCSGVVGSGFLPAHVQLEVQRVRGRSVLQRRLRCTDQDQGRQHDCLGCGSLGRLDPGQQLRGSWRIRLRQGRRPGRHPLGLAALHPLVLIASRDLNLETRRATAGFSFCVEVLAVSSCAA